jgi:hypothetical protein
VATTCTKKNSFQFVSSTVFWQQIVLSNEAFSLRTTSFILCVLFVFTCRQPLQMLLHNFCLVSSMDLSQNYIFVLLSENGFVVIEGYGSNNYFMNC